MDERGHTRGAAIVRPKIRIQNWRKGSRNDIDTYTHSQNRPSELLLMAHTCGEKKHTCSERLFACWGIPKVSTSSGNKNRFQLGHNVENVDDIISDFITLTHSIVKATSSGLGVDFLFYRF